jgi:hypothetical protein
MTKKIKLFFDMSAKVVEDEVNVFIKDKTVKDIKFTTDLNVEHGWFNVLVIYEVTE